MIQAKVIADSLSPMGDRLTTLEVVFPRYILAEGKTHRIVGGMLEQVSIETSVGLNDEVNLSKNSASSRAIPFKKMIKEVENNPFIPYAFQRDHSGMQGTEYITDEEEIKEAKAAWLKARDLAVAGARLLNEGVGISKQLANRPLEAYLYHKVLISATEWENFFNLRCPQYQGKYKTWKSWKSMVEEALVDPNISIQDRKELLEADTLFKLKSNKGQADIHMMFLAEAIYDAIQESIPKKLREGEWHIPYGDQIDKEWLKTYVIDNSLLNNQQQILTETINKISIARCARLSYQTLGDNPVIDYEKDLALYEILATSGHWSPFEHVAKVMNNEEYDCYTRTEPDLSGIYTEKGWCRNFKGFIQQRALMD